MATRSHNLEVFGNVLFNDDIIKEEYHSYLPFNANYNNSDEIIIEIPNHDVFTSPYMSYIRIEGNIDCDDITKITLTNNAFAFLFEEIRYEINGVEIDKVRDVGLTTTLKGYVSYGVEESKILQTAGWFPFNNNKPITSKNFFVNIPLNFLLGFAEDYQKIIIYSKQTLKLRRSRIDSNCYITTDDQTSAQLKINKIEWVIPHVTLNDSLKLEMLTKLKKDNPIHIPFRKWELHELPALKPTTDDNWVVKTSTNLERPRYIIIGFQDNRKDNMKSDVTLFDHLNIRNLKVYLNQESYPYENMNLDFVNNNYVLLYQMYAGFQPSYYYDKNLAHPLFTFEEFKNHLLFVIDCSKQEDKVKSSTVDLRINFESSVQFKSSTRAYCLILYDSVIEYKPFSGLVRKL